MQSTSAPKTGIFSVEKGSNAQCSLRLLHFGTAIPAGRWGMLDICMNKSQKKTTYDASAAGVS